MVAEPPASAVTEEWDRWYACSPTRKGSEEGQATHGNLMSHVVPSRLFVSIFWAEYLMVTLNHPYNGPV